MSRSTWLLYINNASKQTEKAIQTENNSTYGDFQLVGQKQTERGDMNPGSANRRYIKTRLFSSKTLPDLG